MNEKELIEYYNKHNEDKRLKTKHANIEFITAMKYIHEYIKEGYSILDIGAGTGAYSIPLRDEGYDVTAVELVKQNLKYMEKANINCYQGTATDLSKFKDIGVAEIPGFSREFPADFNVQEDIFKYLSENLERRPSIDHYRVTYLSSDNLSLDMIKFLKEHNTLFGKADEKYVIDSNSAGVAVACTLQGIPFVCVKVVEAALDQAQNLDTYSKVLSRYIDLGKGVVQTLSNIGRTDILEGDE